MSKEKYNINYDKFPVILREKLKNKELFFPDDIQFVYNKIKSYRCIAREPEDYTPPNKNDMLSHIENGKVPRGITKEIDKYAISSFMNIEALANAMKLPRPRQKIAEGYVYQEGGPQSTNTKNFHINWWLYENEDQASYFKIVNIEGGKNG